MAQLQESRPTFPPHPEEEPLQEKSCRSRRRLRRRERAEGEEAKKRKLSEDQAKYLETRFWEERKLESGRKVHLASELGLEPKQVAVWFQNRRARWKSKQLEEEYVKLKLAHEGIVLQKCHLEAEMLKLKEQLSEAQDRIEKLSHVRNAPLETINSPSTSASGEIQQPFLGEFGAVGQADQLVYIDEYSYVNMWDFLYGM